MFKQALGFLLNHWPAIYYGYFVGIQRYNRPGWRRFRGGKTIRSFLDEDLIDEYIIYVQPVLLGGGIPLFPAGFPKTAVTLKSCQRIGDMVELIYQRAGGPQGKIDCIPGETVV